MSDKHWRVLAFLLLSGAWLLIMLTWFQRSLIYHPEKVDRLAASAINLPQPIVDVRIKSTDGLTLHGWLSLSGKRPPAGEPDTAALLAKGRPLVLIFPGNGGHRGMRDYLLRVLDLAGADSLIFDYRGFGDNPGRPTETRLASDARTFWQFATEELKVPASRIVLYGESLGGGVAVRLASELCAEGIEPGGLIIQASFNSLVAAGQYHFPVLPVSLVLIDRFDSQKRIPQVTCPILHLHGERDQIVPVNLGKKLFAAAPARSSKGVAKQMVLLPRTNHNDVFGPDYQAAKKGLDGFLAGVAQRANPQKANR